MHQRARDLIEFGEKLFSTRGPLVDLWDEIAMNFYPERADFRHPHTWGEDFASHLTDSYPVLARRELANTLSSMLRPKDRVWFEMTTLRDELDENPTNARWLEKHGAVMRRAMYDPRARFVRATKEGDHDYVTFGQTVIEVGENVNRAHLLYRCWHLKDCVWLEDQEGKVNNLHRKMKVQARNLKRLFGDKIHANVMTACQKEPNKEFELRHILMPWDEYDYLAKNKNTKAKRQPFVSIYIDKDNEHILGESGHPRFNYLVPRWATISGYQYAYSPATMITLPDARLAQAMAQVLLEAGEKAIDPPMTATQEAVKGQIDIRAGGVTWVDAAYDERFGPALKPLEIKGDFQTALALRIDIREMLNKGMYLDKMSLPDSDKEMTAFEVGRRLEEFIRNALPLFEPMEVEYNSSLLDITFDILKDTAAFDWESLPQELEGKDIHFSFENPLQQAEGRAKVAQFQEALALIATATQMGAQIPIDIDGALQDAIHGTGSPAVWMLEDDQLEANKQAANQQAQVDQTVQNIGVGAEVAGTAADSLKRLQEVGLA